MKSFGLVVFLALTALATLHAADPVEFTVGEFTFSRPAEWRWVASNSPMRKAQMAVGDASGAVGDVVFFHFGPGQGGSVEDNVKRWLGQFEKADSSASRSEEVNGRKITFVEASGTYMSGMPGTPATPMEGFAMRAAILESAGGDVYVRFTGPAALVTGAAGAFEEMVKSAAR